MMWCGKRLFTPTRKWVESELRCGSAFCRTAFFFWCGGEAFLQGVLAKKVFSAWFFVVKLW